MNVLEAAKIYLAHTWSVIPIHAKTKIPLVRWKRHQTELPTIKEWEGWYKTFGDCNIALICGKLSGVFAIDFDNQAALEYYKATYDPDVEMTMCQKTPHGMHALFRSGNTRIPLIQPVLEKTDLKGEGSYTVIEPSVHPSGKPYKWINLSPLTDGTDDILDAPACVFQMIEDYKKSKDAPQNKSEHGDAGHIARPQNQEGWEQELLMGVSESERNVAATKLAGLYLSKDYGQSDTLVLLLKWNERNVPPLPGNDIEVVVKSIYGAHQKEKRHGIAEAIEKITIFRYPDGTNKYKLCLSGGKYVLIKMGDLLSSMKTIERIADATRIVFNPPKQQRWFDLVRIWLKAADEKVVAVEESELGIIKEILGKWLVQWKRQKDSEHINMSAMLSNNCVVQQGVVYFTLGHIEEDLRFKNTKLTRTMLCEFLRRLGARITEPRMRFSGSRIRTWEIDEKSFE